MPSQSTYSCFKKRPIVLDMALLVDLESFLTIAHSLEFWRHAQGALPPDVIQQGDKAVALCRRLGKFRDVDA